MVKVTGHASPTATLVVIFTSTALALVIVALRLWTRLGIVRRAGWDDLLVAIALLEACIFTTCVALEGERPLPFPARDRSHRYANCFQWISAWVDISRPSPRMK